MADEHIYKRNFIKKVIFRVDFDDVPTVDEALAAGLLAEITKRYPTKGEQKLFRAEIKLGAGGTEVPSTTSTRLWTFGTSDGTEQLNLNRAFLSVEASQYERFSTFSKNIQPVFDAFMREFKIANVTRIGLRYVNEIAVDSGSAVDWSGFLNERLIAPLGFFEEGDGRLAKELLRLILNKEDCVISVVAGAWNSEFPNPIRKKEFVLDLDCSTNLATETSQVLSRALEFNLHLHGVFEKAVGKSLRELMSK